MTFLGILALVMAACGGDGDGASGASAQRANHYPTRLAQGPDGRIYVSDAKAGSVLFYDEGLNLIDELRGLDRPLGVAVDDRGNVYVGNDGRDNVEVYGAAGEKLFVIDEVAIQMPNDLALDREGNLYVADSLSNLIRVYDSAGRWLKDIGGERLRFPAAVTIAYRGDSGAQEPGELYVADQGNKRVQVFDLQGNFLRGYGDPMEAFSSGGRGQFVRPQSLAVDAQGRLHVADSYLNNVQILDADTGDYLGSYGTFGTGPGQLNLPLDILITSGGEVAVANAENHRVETIYTIE